MSNDSEDGELHGVHEDDDDTSPEIAARTEADGAEVHCSSSIDSYF